MQRQGQRARTSFGAPHAAIALLLVTMSSCGATSTRTNASSDGEIDASALNTQAGMILLTALRDPATERQALLELQMAATAALPWIARARQTHHEHATSVISEALNAELLSLLAARGDTDAVTELQRSASRDPIVTACRIAVLDPNDHRTEIRVALQHSSERVRAAALRRLQHAAWDPALMVEVAERARLDPIPKVRADALETLASQGRSAIELLEARLLDPDPLPRAVAMRELSRLDCTRAHASLAHWLSDAPSRDGLAAVRALSRCGNATIAQTVDQLRRALAASEVLLRSEAATTADTLAWLTIPEWIAGPLAHDPVASVRLALALAVQPTHPRAARTVLMQLAQGVTSMVSVQAAATLAAQGDPSATKFLLAARTQRDPKLRRVAFVALGRVALGRGHAQASALEVGLHDEDVSVRLATAGTLLRVTHPLL